VRKPLPLQSEYVDAPQDDMKVKLRKQMQRQRNLQNLTQHSQVCVVSDPYVLSLDGLPNIDIVFDDFKQPRSLKKKSTTLLEDMKDSRDERGRFQRLSRPKMYSCLSRLMHTKKSRKVKISESVSQLKMEDLSKRKRDQIIANNYIGGMGASNAARSIQLQEQTLLQPNDV